MIIAMANAICSLGHGLRLTAVPRSTQPCIPSGSLNRVPASAGVRPGLSALPSGRQHCVIPYMASVFPYSGDVGLLSTRLKRIDDGYQRRTAVLGLLTHRTVTLDYCVLYKYSYLLTYIHGWNMLFNHHNVLF